jgi:ribulose-phosphate 3-epimerase
MQVIPAILPKSYNELLEKFERVKDFQNLIQIDLVDGVVGKEKTWLPKEGEDLRDFPQHDFQFDLMVNDWKSMSYALSAFMSIHSFVFHIDSFQEAEVITVSGWCKENNIKCGFSISNDTAVDVLMSAVYLARENNRDVFVQVMGIHTIGLQGQLFDETCLMRIRKVRESFNDILIQVDGAMRPETAKKVKLAGADVCVVGSYLFGREEISLPLEELSLI